MPKPPGFVDKFNFVIDFFQNPCDAPFMLYVETAHKAAGKAVLSLLSFGMDDIARGFFRPKGLRSGRHGRKRNQPGRRRRGNKRIGSFPELGEEIGKRIPGAAKAGEPVEDVQKFLWRIDGGLQRGMYYWMIADVTNDFFYNWASAIQDASPQRCGQEPRFLRTAPEWGGVGVLPMWSINANILEWYEDIQGGINGATLGPGTWFVTVSSKGKSGSNLNSHTGEFFLQANLSNLDPQSRGSGLKTVGRDADVGFVCSGTFRGPVFVAWYLHIVQGEFYGENASVWVQKIDK